MSAEPDCAGRYYRGRRINRRCHVWRPDGSPLPLRLDVARRSPTGFEWGYGGSGPHQLALALLLDVLPAFKDVRDLGAQRWTEVKLLALSHAQGFKCRLIACLGAEWDLHPVAITSYVIAAADEEKLETPYPWERWRSALRDAGYLAERGVTE